jgi:exodeoxyribonuclease VII small subunit
MTGETEPTFEQLYAELEETVRRLETGESTLEEALALYEHAATLVEQCNALLDRAELRIRKVTEGPAGGLQAAPLPDQ